MKQIQKKKIEKKDLSDEYNFLENSNDAFNMFTCSEKAFVTRILIIIKFLLVRLSSHQALRIIMI